MRIVITYQHRGKDEYLHLIKSAFASAHRLGYETVSVGNVEMGDRHLPFAADAEPYLMNWILAAQLSYINSPLFSCDSVLFSPDALIVKPLEPIFTRSFDVAFTDRANKRWPINNGVIFLKPKHQAGLAGLWEDALEICRAYPKETQEWYGDQQALHDALRFGIPEKHHVGVRMLPCAEYNASPNGEDLDTLLLKTAYIIHLKGKRKHMMAKYWESICARTLH